MKLDICHKKEDNVLFSIDLNKNNDKVSKTIVFAPNGVGKTSIANCFLENYNSSNSKDFFIKNYKTKDISFKLFNEDNFKNKIPNLFFQKSFLTESLKKQIKLEKEWIKYSFIFGQVLHMTEKNTFIKLKENTHFTPYIENNHFGYEISWNLNYSFFNKRRINSLLEIIDLHVELIKSFKLKHNKDQKEFSNFLLNNQENYKNQIMNKINNFRKFISSVYEKHDLIKNLNDKFKDLSIYYYSWEFMKQIYHFFESINLELINGIILLKDNLDYYEDYLLEYKRVLYSFKKNLNRFRMFNFCNWIKQKDYINDLKKVKNNLQTFLKIKGINCEIFIEHERLTASFYVRINLNNKYSMGERRQTNILVWLNLIVENNEFLIFDDSITSLDYFHTSIIVTWLKKLEISYLFLTHSFSFFSKFLSKDKDSLSIKTYLLDKFNDNMVFCVEFTKKDSNFAIGKFVDFWRNENISLDSFILALSLVYELIKQFSIEINVSSRFLENINNLMHVNINNKSKTIREFVNKNTGGLLHYIDIFLIKQFFTQCICLFLNDSEISNSILNINLNKYITNWDTNKLNNYQKRIIDKENEFNFFDYFMMKYLLIKCCNAKIRNLNLFKLDKKDSLIKEIENQINPLEHFDHLRFISLLEITCEKIVQNIFNLNQIINDRKHL